MKLAAAFSVVCFLTCSTAAFAAETSAAGAHQSSPIKIIVKAGGQTIEDRAEVRYSYDAQAGDEISGIRISTKDYSAPIEVIQHQSTSITAIGEDGPWEDLKGTEVTSEWENLPFPQDQSEFILTLPADEPSSNAVLSAEEIALNRKKFERENKEGR